MKGLRIVLSSMIVAGTVSFASAQVTPDTSAAAENQVDMENQKDFQHGIRYDQELQQDTTTAMEEQQDTTGFGFEGAGEDTTAFINCPEDFSKRESLKELKNVEGDVKLEYETDQGSYKYQKEGNEITEEFEGEEMEAMLKKNKSGKKEFEYESDSKEYQYEETDSKIKESYEGPKKEWEVEKEKKEKRKK